MAEQEETLSSLDLFSKASYLDSIEDVQRVISTPTSISHEFPGSIVFGECACGLCFPANKFRIIFRFDAQQSDVH